MVMVQGDQIRDALTRQVSEAVSNDLRGSGVLTSKSENTHCKLPKPRLQSE